MPKDEFDFADPFELTGHALVTAEDTTDAMCECMVEEFMRLGHSPGRILQLFQTPFYVGMNLVLQKRGEPFVRDRIREVFERWSRPFSWVDVKPESEGRAVIQSERAGESCAPVAALTDPLGGAIPNLI